MTTLTHESTIKAALRNYVVLDAARLYEAALSVASLASLLDPAALRVVSDMLTEEASRTDEKHTREVLAAMAMFLTFEASDR